jgi:hypothetical protein
VPGETSEEKTAGCLPAVPIRFLVYFFVVFFVAVFFLADFFAPHREPHAILTHPLSRTMPYIRHIMGDRPWQTPETATKRLIFQIAPGLTHPSAST